MKKRIFSLFMSMIILMSCYSLGFGALSVNAREVGIGTGAESFNPVDFYPAKEVMIGNDVNTTLNVEIINKEYKVRINSITAYIPYYAEGGFAYLDVAYTPGTVVGGTQAFAVTGSLAEDVNSIVRYTIEYDILDADNKNVWKNLTGYAYAFISSKDSETGPVGTYHEYPGQLSDGCYFEVLETLNTTYVQQFELQLLYKIRTQSGLVWNYHDPRTRGVNVISGNAPSTLVMMPDNLDAQRQGQMDWPKCDAVYRSASADWLRMSEPESGYYNFTISFNSWNDEWEDQSNITETTEMYYIRNIDKVNAYNVANNIIKTKNTFNSGYFLQKGLYTEESWNRLVEALDIAYQVALSVPNANFGYKVACINAQNADNAVENAFASLEKAEHDFYTYADAVIVEPTCTKDGSEFLTCICGEEKLVINPAKGHVQGDWELVKEATCTEEGYYELRCTVCNEVINTRVLSKIAHNYEKTVTAPTCTKNGYTTNTCSVCGDSYISEYVDPTGHSYETYVVEPTCTKKGGTTHICSVCSSSYTDNYTAPTGHTAGESVEENRVEPTCTANGSFDTVVHCATCNVIISRETTVLEAYGHTPGDWVVTKEVEGDIPGEKSIFCETCGEVLETKEIPAVSAYFVKAEGSTTVIDTEHGFIYGLSEDINDLEGYVEYAGGVVEYQFVNEFFGTGTVVNFVVNDEIAESYRVIIFGDVYSDGVIDSFDVAVVSAYVNGDIEIEEGSEFYFAADVYADGVIDSFDLAVLMAYVNGDSEILQTSEIIFDK